MGELHVPVFGGGIVLAGSADAKRTDELSLADSVDIGLRGQLVMASDRVSAFDATDGATHPLTPVYGLEAAQIPQGSFLIAIGDFGGHTQLATVNLDGTSPAATALIAAALTGGLSVTFATLPFVGNDLKQKRVVLVNLGARPGQNPSAAPGLYALVYDPAGPSYTLGPISNYDALGTGTNGEFPGGTKAKQLNPRGIIAYNNHTFLWGFDNNDSAGPANRDGPNRLMFGNIGNPLKYGLDPAPPPAVEADRDFADSDAFTVGGAGDSIRAGRVWAGRLNIGTERGLHFVEGYGRESFLTNGAMPIIGSSNVVGPHAMTEGPDRLLHGVGDDGHWIFDGSRTDLVGAKLRNFARKSPGYWDLIWSDPSASTGFPGKSNQDLVWMLSVPELMQVWIVIPYCSISNGYGSGSDTVIIKYHILTGGYTRQKFAGTILTHGLLYKRDQTAVGQILLASPGSSKNISRYGYRATGAASPPLASALPDVQTAEYAPFGPDGAGIQRKAWLTLAWETAATTLGLVFTLTPTIDGKDLTSQTVTISASTPGAPANGDVWIDTSGTDSNIGNGTAGSFIPASAADYLVKVYVTTWAKWYNTGVGGTQGNRITFPVAHDYKKGTRIMYRLLCTAADRRFQLEGLGEKPTTVADAKGGE